MKGRKIGYLLILIVLCLSGCGRLSESSEMQKEDKNEDNKETTIKSTENQSAMMKEDGDQYSTSDKPEMITIYYCNNDATAFASEKMKIFPLTPEDILEVLISKGVVASDVQITEFNIVTIEDKPSIEMDFNNAFKTFIANMGTTGEYYTIGSICNTFLNAYDCEQIKITVEGQTLTTGHAEYPGYMTTFE